jgi:HPt (histidine-containing phosphotransfer) domain-containing protein
MSLSEPDVSNKDIFNLKELRESFMNNDEIACSLLLRFIERTSRQIEDIISLRKAGDWETARREAHTIKGASLTLGGRELGNAAGRLELAFKNVDHSEMEAAYNPVKEAFDRFKICAEDFIKSAQSPAK